MINGSGCRVKNKALPASLSQKLFSILYLFFLCLWTFSLSVRSQCTESRNVWGNFCPLIRERQKTFVEDFCSSQLPWSLVNLSVNPKKINLDRAAADLEGQFCRILNVTHFGINSTLFIWSKCGFRVIFLVWLLFPWLVLFMSPFVKTGSIFGNALL